MRYSVNAHLVKTGYTVALMLPRLLGWRSFVLSPHALTLFRTTPLMPQLFSSRAKFSARCSNMGVDNAESHQFRLTYY